MSHLSLSFTVLIASLRFISRLNSMVNHYNHSLKYTLKFLVPSYFSVFMWLGQLWLNPTHHHTCTCTPLLLIVVGEKPANWFNFKFMLWLAIILYCPLTHSLSLSLTTVSFFLPCPQTFNTSSCVLTPSWWHCFLSFQGNEAIRQESLEPLFIYSSLLFYPYTLSSPLLPWMNCPSVHPTI